MDHRTKWEETVLTLFYSPHALSVDNEARRASGHADVALSERGEQLAEELGRHYATEAIDAIFSSDLQRAYRTAEIAFLGRGLPIVGDSRLRECDYGDMTQYPAEQIDFAMHIAEPFPGGESLLMVVQKVGTFLEDILREYDGQVVLVIGHAATKHAIEYWLGDASLEELVHARWEWRDVPIWRYELHSNNLKPKLSSKLPQESP